MSNEKLKVLIVDDEVNVRNGLGEALGKSEYSIDTAPDGETAIAKIRSRNYHIVVTDLRMPGGIDGVDVLQAARDRHPDSAVILITAFGTLEGAVEAMKLGAADFISKPVDIGHFRVVIQKAADRLKLLRENRDLKVRLRIREGKPDILAESPAMKRAVESLMQVAASNATVLLQGESGVGKELAARAVHENSPRKDKPFVTINCGALPETLFESEVFGHEVGAYTGAKQAKKGVFEQADGGTLFLDEITEIPEKNQVDLLRVLQEGEVRRVGADHSIKVDVRVVAASNRDIQRCVEEGAFREDLYYRLSVIPVVLPPLRHRKEDLPRLVDSFLKEFSATHGKNEKTLSAAAFEGLAAYSWPGNVRQLRNIIERLVLTCPGEAINAKDLPLEVRSSARGPSSLNLDVTVESAEREVIQRALKEVGGKREKAAEILGISVRTLQYKLRRLSIE